MLGEQLIKLRSSRTQEEISQLIGVSRATYSHYENNRVEPDLTTLKTISKIFHVSVDFLLDNESFQTQVDWKDKESNCVYSLGETLKSLRGKLSLREAAKRSGLSYSYINSLENGKHPRTGAPINPTPDILRSLANAYDYSYKELMKVAGYITEEDSRISTGEKFMEIGELLRSIRGSDSLRVASEKTGLSHNFISIVERGVDSRGFPSKPSPESLTAYSSGYNYPYRELMKVAGYISEDDSKLDYDIDPSMYRLIKKIEELSQEKRQLVESLIDAILEKNEN